LLIAFLFFHRPLGPVKGVGKANYQMTQNLTSKCSNFYVKVFHCYNSGSATQVEFIDVKVTKNPCNTEQVLYS
jgi:hypothetical protein